jgi:imidazolonepropionase-like amidohydrolase
MPTSQVISRPTGDQAAQRIIEGNRLDLNRPEQYDGLVIAIRCSRMFTGERFSQAPVTVLVDGKKIIGVETGHIDLDESWEVAEYPNATVLLGLIDTHVHLVADNEVGALDRVPALGEEALDAIITDSLRRQLAAGVTTVRDLGDSRYAASPVATSKPTMGQPTRSRQSWRRVHP